MLELDLQTGRSRELESRGWRLALSADGEQVVMLAGNNQVFGVMLIALNFVNLDTLVENQLLYKLYKKTGEIPGALFGWPRNFLQLRWRANMGVHWHLST